MNASSSSSRGEMAAARLQKVGGSFRPSSISSSRVPLALLSGSVPFISSAHRNGLSKQRKRGSPFQAFQKTVVPECIRPRIQRRFSPSGVSSSAVSDHPLGRRGSWRKAATAPRGRGTGRTFALPGEGFSRHGAMAFGRGSRSRPLAVAGREDCADSGASTLTETALPRFISTAGTTP